MSWKRSRASLAILSLFAASSSTLTTLSCARAAPKSKMPGPEAFETPSAAWFFDRGRERARAGDGVRAEQYVAAAVRRGYPEAAALPLLLDICLAEQRLRSALNYAEPYSRRHPQSLPLQRLVAALHLALGQAPQARRQLQAILRRAPRSGSAHYLMAIIAAEHDGDSAAARDHYETYLALEPHGAYAPEARTWLAEQAEAATATTKLGEAP